MLKLTPTLLSPVSVYPTIGLFSPTVLVIFAPAVAVTIGVVIRGLSSGVLADTFVCVPKFLVIIEAIPVKTAFILKFPVGSMLFIGLFSQ